MYNGWMYNDPYGVSHSFGDIYVVSNSSPPSGCPNTTNISSATAVDGSGYVIHNIAGPGGPTYGSLQQANGAAYSAGTIAGGFAGGERRRGDPGRRNQPNGYSRFLDPGSRPG